MSVPPIGSATPTPGSAEAKLRRAAMDLEAVFYGQLFQAMRDAAPMQGAVETSSAEKMFTSMLDDQIARLAAGRTHRGLADAMYRQLSRHLPAADAAAQAPSPQVGRIDGSGS